RAHQLVGVKAALHDRLRLALAHELDRHVGGCVTEGRVDYRDRRQINCTSPANFFDARARPDEYRRDEPKASGIDRALERRLIARMSDGGRRGGQTPAELEQSLVFFVDASSWRPRDVVGRRGSRTRYGGHERRFAVRYATRRANVSCSSLAVIVTRAKGPAASELPSSMMTVPSISGASAAL